MVIQGFAPVRWFVVASIVFVVAPTSLGQQGGGQYSLEDWLTMTRVRSFVLSPSGRDIFYTSDAGNSGTTEIFRVSVNGGDPVQLSTNPANVRPEPKQDLAISANGSTLFFTSARYFQNYANIFRMPTSGGPATQLTFNDAVIETAPAPSPDGKTLAYFARTRGGTQIFLLILEKARQWPQPLAPASDNERFPVWAPDGTKLAFSKAGDIWLRDLPEGQPERLVTGALAGRNRSPVWSPDGNRIAFLTSKSGFAQVGVADVETGAVTPITYEPREHAQVAWSPDGKWLAFVRNDATGMSRELVITMADGTRKPSVLSRGKGMRSRPQFLRTGDRIAFIEATDTQTADIWTVRLDGSDPRQITNSMGKIDAAALSIPEEVTYPGSDNLPIPALVYKPKNIEAAKRYPAIVRLHGHPGQWNHSMYMEWQYFVQQGFVLIAPNPRGSRGFGQGFHDLHIGDYGGAEYEDVMRALDYLRQLPYVDMTRKATWGGSGGGYLSFVIATKAPKTFQAQVIRAPVSSWQQLAIDRFGSSGRAWTRTRTPRRERSEFGGPYAEIPEEYDKRSPINFVDKVEVPQLLLHGLRDSSVLSNQSEMWVARMVELGKGELVDYVEYPDEDHGLRRYRKTIRDRLQRMDRFFAKHLRLDALRAQSRDQ